MAGPVWVIDATMSVEGRDEPKSGLELVRAAKELATLLITEEGSTPARAIAVAVARAALGIPAGDHPAMEFCRTVLRRQVALAVCLAVADLEAES